MDGRKAWQSLPKESSLGGRGIWKDEYENTGSTLSLPRSPCSCMSDPWGIKLRGSHKIPEVFIFLTLEQDLFTYYSQLRQEH